MDIVIHIFPYLYIRLYLKIHIIDQFKLLPILITNNHILNNDDIKSNKIINISFNDDKIFKDLKIEERTTYTNEDIDITII